MSGVAGAGARLRCPARPLYTSCTRGAPALRGACLPAFPARHAAAAKDAIEKKFKATQTAIYAKNREAAAAARAAMQGAWRAAPHAACPCDRARQPRAALGPSRSRAAEPRRAAPRRCARRRRRPHRA